MVDWKERGKIAMLWGGLVCLVAITICGCLFLLQGREMEATTSGSAVAIQADIHDIHDRVTPVLEQLPTVLDDTDGTIRAAGLATTSVSGHVDRAIDINSDALHTAITTNSADLDATLHRVSDECPTPAQVADGDTRHCGLIENANDALHTYRGTAGVLEKAIYGFTKHEGDLYDQETALYGKADHAFGALDALMSKTSLGLIIDHIEHMLDTGAKVEDKLAKCTLTPNFGCYFRNYAMFTAQLGGYLLH